MGSLSLSARVYRFGVFALDSRTGELANGGKKTPLREQPLRLLLALLEHPGDLVTREELVRPTVAGRHFRRFRPRTEQGSQSPTGSAGRFGRTA